MASAQETSSASPAPVIEPVVELTTDQKFERLAEQLQAVAGTVRTLQLGVKTLQREVRKAAAQAGAKGGRRVVDPERKKRAPSGFTLPTGMSAELCAFLGVEPSTQLARVEVTRLINRYIKDHGLQNPSDKRTILPDAALGAILSASSTPLTYFNLQSRIKHHFVAAVAREAQ